MVRPRKSTTPLKWFYKSDQLEAGLDEVARGCLFGRVYAAVVIWPTAADQIEDDSETYLQIQDSKKLNREKRHMLRDYITEHALEYAFSFVEANIIDEINILQASYQAMHQAMDSLNILPDMLLVDGDKFKPYLHKKAGFLAHECVVGGDNDYFSIAAASIVAKVYHDEWIKDICCQYPDLDRRYGLTSNMGYGSQIHREGIQEHGSSQFHRKTFGICKSAPVVPVAIASPVMAVTHYVKIEKV